MWCAHNWGHHLFLWSCQVYKCRIWIFEVPPIPFRLCHSSSFYESGFVLSRFSHLHLPSLHGPITTSNIDNKICWFFFIFASWDQFICMFLLQTSLLFNKSRNGLRVLALLSSYYISLALFDLPIKWFKFCIDLFVCLCKSRFFIKLVSIYMLSRTCVMIGLSKAQASSSMYCILGWANVHAVSWNVHEHVTWVKMTKEHL